jgi:putative transposase
VGFGAFRTCLAYKLKRQGKHLFVVDQFTPTAKTCSVCGAIRREKLPYSEHHWTCPVCGTRHDRAVNAAKNIKTQGLAQYYGTQGSGLTA